MSTGTVFFNVSWEYFNMRNQNVIILKKKKKRIECTSNQLKEIILILESISFPQSKKVKINLSQVVTFI